jgi:hypothetical protein
MFGVHDDRAQGARAAVVQPLPVHGDAEKAGCAVGGDAGAISSRWRRVPSSRSSMQKIDLRVQPMRRCLAGVVGASAQISAHGSGARRRAARSGRAQRRRGWRRASRAISAASIRAEQVGLASARGRARPAVAQARDAAPARLPAGGDMAGERPQPGRIGHHLAVCRIAAQICRPVLQVFVQSARCARHRGQKTRPAGRRNAPCSSAKFIGAGQARHQVLAQQTFEQDAHGQVISIATGVPSPRAGLRSRHRNMPDQPGSSSARRSR